MNVHEPLSQIKTELQFADIGVSAQPHFDPNRPAPNQIGTLGQELRARALELSVPRELRDKHPRECHAAARCLTVPHAARYRPEDELLASLVQLQQQRPEDFANLMKHLAGGIRHD